ncbi:MAG TPA: TolC family protein, partial [Myxococcota bacterium]
MRRLPRSFAVAALTFAVATTSTTGCVPSLEYNPPRDARAVVPERFATDASTATEAPVATDTQTSVGTQDWRSYFASAELRGLVDEALKNNQELNIQLQELIIGRAEVDARYGELFPKVGAGIGAGIEKVGGQTSQGRADELTGLPQHLPDFRFGLRGSWEVDVWGKLR